MSTPAILYENALTVGTLTATSTASSYHVNSLLTRDPYLRWKAGGTGTIDIVVDHALANAQAVDTLAITLHNLHECGGTLKVGQSDDGSAWTEATILDSTGMAATLGRTAFLDVSSVSGIDSAHRYHRIRFDTTTSAVYAGCIALGRRLDLTEYFVEGFDPFAVDIKLNAPRSRTGNMLRGCVESVKQTVDLRFTKSGIASAFFHDAQHSKMGATTPNWREFMSEVWSQGLPFWLSFDHGIQSYRQGWFAWPKRDDDTSMKVITPRATRYEWKFDAVVYAEGFGPA